MKMLMDKDVSQLRLLIYKVHYRFMLFNVYKWDKNSSI